MAENTESNTFNELKTMVVDYAKQETVGPLKNLGMWAGFGVAGAIFWALGLFLLGLGSLRLLQSMSWTSGTWSFAPYLIIFAVLLVLIGLCVNAASKRPDWMQEEN